MNNNIKKILIGGKKLSLKDFINKSKIDLTEAKKNHTISYITYMTNIKIQNILSELLKLDFYYNSENDILKLRWDYITLKKLSKLI